MKSEISKDGRKLYTCIMVYVGDLLIISKDANFYIDEISSQFRLKQDSIGPPDIYLSINIYERHIDGEKNYWATGSDKYLKEAIRIIEGNMKDEGIVFT